MNAAIRLTVLTGPHKNDKFWLRGARQYRIGRGEDCAVKLAGAGKDQLISRYHCRLDVDFPSIQVRDLGSRNGTYVNGKKVDPDSHHRSGAAIEGGDILTIGGTTVKVDVVDCPPDANA